VASLSHRFRKNDLRHARIISQIDRKFIACLFEDWLGIGGPGGDNSDRKSQALVLIDQHAADERVRVEYFLKELCLGFLHDQDKVGDLASGVQVRELSPPFPVLLTVHEAQQLNSSPHSQTAFRHWGFRFADLSNVRFHDSGTDSADGDSNAVYTQVLVQGIPEVVGDKVWATITPTN